MMRKWSFMVWFVWSMALGLSACAGSGADSTSTSLSFTDVSEINTKALKLYEEEKFEESLKQYAEAMKANPVDMDARIGTIQCQLAMENYELAATNLSAAFQVEPKNEVLYDLYIELSEKSNTIFYAREAVDLAKRYQVQSFLDRMPSPPEIAAAEGEYNSRLEVEITAEEGTKIYVSEKKDGKYPDIYQYSLPVPVTRGVTELEVYSVKEGIPSDTVTARYVCEYDPAEVTFEDPVFEKIVRATIGRMEGSITDEECEEVTSLNQYVLQSVETDYEEYRKQKLHTLNDLYWFPDLQQLYLDSQDTITDFSSVVQCRKLYSLIVRDSGLSDISFVKDMSNLEYLEVSGNQIGDVTPLSFCHNLYELGIDGNPVKDLTPLKDLDITYLNADMSQLSDGEVLKNWDNLSSLSLYESSGFDGSILKGKTKLEQLYLYSGNSQGERGMPIGDISFIQELPQLQRLSLNGLADYSQVSMAGSLSNLQYLYFRTQDYSEPPEELTEELRRNLPGCDIHY